MKTAQYNKIVQLQTLDYTQISTGQEGNTDTLYDWSPRGPTYEENPGVTFCAPGEAIASVARWQGKQKRKVNGTFMAFPNPCGGVALILSGLKQNQVKYCPVRVRALSYSYPSCGYAYSAWIVELIAIPRGLFSTCDILCHTNL